MGRERAADAFADDALALLLDALPQPREDPRSLLRPTLLTRIQRDVSPNRSPSNTSSSALATGSSARSDTEQVNRLLA
jgi:hypothetical protein